MSDYEPVYEELFVRNLRRYASIREAIKRRVERVLADPYMSTEALGDISGRLNLIGCRDSVEKTVCQILPTIASTGGMHFLFYAGPNRFYWTIFPLPDVLCRVR